MAKKRARSKSTSPAASSKRPVAPSFDLAPPRAEAPAAADSLAPVASPVEPEPQVAPALLAAEAVDPMGATFAAQERVTTPACPRASEGKLSTHDVDEDAFFATADAAVAREAAAEREAARRAALEEAAASLPPPPAPEVLARRRILRRAVSAVVGAAAMFGLVAGVSVTQARAGKKDVSVASNDTHAQMAFVAPAAAKIEAPANVEPAVKVEAVVPASAPPVAAEPAAAVAPAAAPAPAAEKPVEVTPVAEKAADPAPAAEKVVDPAAAKALTKEALGLLERGAFAKAIDKAKASVEADPSDASAYLYWGTALMETGKRAEAKTVFAACVADAKRGPKHECAQFK